MYLFFKLEVLRKPFSNSVTILAANLKQVASNYSTLLDFFITFLISF